LGHARITELSSLLEHGLKDAGGTLVTLEDPALCGGVVVIAILKETQKAVADAMYTKFGIAASTNGDCDSARTSTICPHIYNARAHIMRAIDGIASMRDLIRFDAARKRGRSQWRER
jgi:hypothetical protein